MNEELDYAEMLEIPVSTVNVVKKKSIFKRKAKPEEDLKEQVVETVNERMGAYIGAEDYTDPPRETRKVKLTGGENFVVMCEAIAVCLLAVGIFITNLFLPNSAINTFINSFTATAATETEADYSDFTLSSVTSELADCEVTLSGGVMSFTAETAVYPVCDGEIASVTSLSGGYTVEIAHTSKFTSVITGLTAVYSAAGDTVKSNLPFAYSDGTTEVKVSLYNDGTLLSGYTLSGAVPVWNS